MMRVALISTMLLAGCERGSSGEADASGNTLIMLWECFGWCEAQTISGADAGVVRSRETDVQ